MEGIKNITLGFENCEIMDIPANVIGDFHLGKIYTEISRLACNYIGKTVCADELAIEIFAEGNTEYYPFDVKKDKISKFDRINSFKDITSIDIEYDDGSTETYWLDYEPVNDSLGAPSDNQKVYISDVGNLYLVIAKDKVITSFFDLDAINDKEYMDFQKDMLDIGVEEEYWHDFSEEMPETYRYLYIEDKEGEMSTAVYVNIKNGMNTFINANLQDKKEIHIPVRWKYVTTNIVKDFEENPAIHHIWTMNDIKKSFPSKED